MVLWEHAQILLRAVGNPQECLSFSQTSINCNNVEFAIANLTPQNTTNWKLSLASDVPQWGFLLVCKNCLTFWVEFWHTQRQDRAAPLSLNARAGAASHGQMALWWPDSNKYALRSSLLYSMQISTDWKPVFIIFYHNFGMRSRMTLEPLLFMQNSRKSWWSVCPTRGHKFVIYNALCTDDSNFLLLNQKGEVFSKSPSSKKCIK